MIKGLLLFVSIAIWSHAFANEICSYDLNGDGKCDAYEISYPNDDDQSILSIKIGGGSAISKGTFDFGDGGLSPGYFPTDFELLLDFHTRDADLRAYTFRWNDEIQDWVLDRIAEWKEPSRDEIYTLEKHTVPEDKVLPQDFSVSRIECCTRLSGFSATTPIKKLSDEDAQQHILRDFAQIKKSLPLGASSSLFYLRNGQGDSLPRNIPIDFVYELTKIVGPQSVGDINDYAFFMYKNKMFILADMLLESVHAQFPDRVVAILNLADVKWALGFNKEACRLYTNYLDKMTQAGKISKVPSYVAGRTSCSG
jgi:hypothetical protein